MSCAVCFAIWLASATCCEDNTLPKFCVVEDGRKELIVDCNNVRTNRDDVCTSSSDSDNESGEKVAKKWWGDDPENVHTPTFHEKYQCEVKIPAKQGLKSQALGGS
jgi:hypothetical protein